MKRNLKQHFVDPSGPTASHPYPIPADGSPFCTAFRKRNENLSAKLSLYYAGQTQNKMQEYFLIRYEVDAGSARSDTDTASEGDFIATEVQDEQDELSAVKLHKETQTERCCKNIFVANDVPTDTDY